MSLPKLSVVQSPSLAPRVDVLLGAMALSAVGQRRMSTSSGNHPFFERSLAILAARPSSSRVEERMCHALSGRADCHCFSDEMGSSDGVDTVVSSASAAGWNCIPRRFAPRVLPVPTLAGTARNSARLNFGFMENMVIE
jgi:hypothetical protein